MPIHDIADHPLTSSLQDAFGPQVDDDLVDIVEPNDQGEINAWEVQADAWTLVLEGWPLDNAWIAIDDDPAAPEQFRTALEAVLDQRDLAALASVDEALGGALVSALEASGDELTIALAALLSADETG